MKIEDNIFKSTLINLVQSLMCNETYDEFIKQKYAISELFENKYKADGDVAMYKQAMSALSNLKYQVVLNKVADKNEELLLQLNEMEQALASICIERKLTTKRI